MDPILNRSIQLSNKSPETLRKEIRASFHQTADFYESLFECLASDEAYFVKPISLRHPLIFYYGHTNTFFINKLILSGLVTKRVNPQFESMFAVGVDEMGWDDVNDQNYDWPKVEEVKAYRAKVRQVVDQLISELPLNLPIDWESPWWIILMGIEHERIHLETSSVLIRQHALKYVKPSANWPVCAQQQSPAPLNTLVNIKARDVKIGKQDATYGWDNEYGAFEKYCSAFQAAKYLTSNAEFLAFVEAGGYANDDYWAEEGLSWK